MILCIYMFFQYYRADLGGAVKIFLIFMIISNFKNGRQRNQIWWGGKKPEITICAVQTHMKLDLDFEMTVKMEGVWAGETHRLGYFCLLNLLYFRALIMKN